MQLGPLLACANEVGDRKRISHLRVCVWLRGYSLGDGSIPTTWSGIVIFMFDWKYGTWLEITIYLFGWRNEMWFGCYDDSLWLRQWDYFPYVTFEQQRYFTSLKPKFYKCIYSKLKYDQLAYISCYLHTYTIWNWTALVEEHSTLTNTDCTSFVQIIVG
jgi:hypothetical protein